MKMKLKSRRDQEIFSLSFLDVISCGFGAIVLLVLLSKDGVLNAGPDLSVIMDQIKVFATSQASYDKAQEQIEQLRKQIADNEARRKANEQTLSQSDSSSDRLDEQLRQAKANLANAQKNLEKASEEGETTASSPEIVNVSGIPVDRKYVIFIVDTSGSMGNIWDRVMNQVESILEVHPEVKGFQIMNDSGTYLIDRYAGRWITDSPRIRKSVLNLMRSWSGISGSNPVPGILKALKSFSKYRKDTAIYVMGDEFRFKNYDAAVEEINRANRDPATGKPLARIHGIGFYNDDFFWKEFATLMREISRMNNGAFVATH